MTAVAAVRKGHGELAVGYVIGTDILNVLFVAGAAAAVTKDGVFAPAGFFQILYPGMLVLLLGIIGGMFLSKGSIKRPFGAGLILIHLTITVLSYT